MAHITDVLKKPVFTEKSMTLQAEENKYTFDVDVNANKIEIKQAVEAMFDVKVESVNAVYYTHLDVYKRQPLKRWRMSCG